MHPGVTEVISFHFMRQFYPEAVADQRPARRTLPRGQPGGRCGRVHEPWMTVTGVAARMK